MAIVTNYIGATLRMRNQDDDAAGTLNKIRQDISGADIVSLKNAYGIVRGETIKTALLTQTSEILE